MSNRWRTFAVALVLLPVLYFGFTRVVLPIVMNPNIARVCSRSFERSAQTVSQNYVTTNMGDLKKVGEARSGSALYTSTRAWPDGHCGQPFATVLISHAGDGTWRTWALKGGP
jgi:hypothetical protein